MVPGEQGGRTEIRERVLNSRARGFGGQPSAPGVAAQMKPQLVHAARRRIRAQAATSGEFSVFQQEYRPVLHNVLELLVDFTVEAGQT